ncbi:MULTISPECIES: magnesium and cobalt transport protein CorA [Pseudoxanthomonas]|uniref:Magnesium and cobalt transport protein CorA n=1 Tax=Pseudoxanthomonas winnipegensis TaxID=2480810 RepID=A0AAW8GA72_9GAMM|nr:MULTISPECIES: magnesium and cobalt transport protein CorA [Pseudoxanthomonas]MDQ1118478.1 magnesium transporter [Pseudoxanthomonas winnipegensis]MDQ1131662.1 magnesium transporter [Pseudoxanthomonas winnipegensis]MDR6138319.1 magnesium transporter [Pseudoxanthomonas sp. SORGH_AS_0997]TAA08160.1 magnesium and cobalt transport protein CorA [Pseudoxanthomonas winnipegensis]TAA21151.1 magnesium and cobalt transport protein CorA [Pseudoxanthomonas winnipegensis]
MTLLPHTDALPPVPQPPSAPGNPACVITCAAYDRQGTRTNLTLDEISDVLARDDGSFVWVGLYEPEEHVLLKLQEEFCLHPLAVEDAGKAHQRPKLETYGHSLFMAMHTVQVIDGHIRYGETQAFLGQRYLITVRHGASLSYTPARQRIEREPELLKLGPAYCLYTVLDFIVDNYLPIIEESRDTLFTLERDIFSETYRGAVVRRLYDLKRELTLMRVAVGPLQDVLAQLVRTQNPLVPEEIRLYMRDVHDHALRVNDGIDTLREMLGTALSVNLSLVTLGQGETVKRLGAWAALLAAPTLMTSWYGMNFEGMPELHARFGYWVLIGAVAVTCGVLYVLFKRARWL